MPVPTSIDDLSTNAIENSPQGTEPAKGTIDDYFRRHAGFIAELRDLVATFGVGAGEFLQAGTGAVPRSVRDKARETVSVMDFGALGDGVQNESPKIAAALAALTTLGGGVLVFPPGDYRLASMVTIPANVTLLGAWGSNGYHTTVARKSRLFADASGMTMLYTTSRNIALRELCVDGMGIAAKAFHANGTAASLAFHHYENCDFIRVTDYAMHLQATGLVRAQNVQVSNALKCGIFMDGYCGDSNWSDIYVNTCDVDNTSTAFVQAGVGVWIGYGSNNMNWRGGKIEYNRIGMVVADAQGINIAGVNFDVCRRYSIAVIGNGDPADGSNDPLTARSVTITGCRFLGGEPRTQTNTAHVFGQFSRGVVVTGNTFRKAADLAYDYNVNGGAAQGPHYGIQLNSAERWVIAGNDLQGAATVNCIRIYHDTPASAEHVVGNNKIDGTQDILDAHIASVRHYGPQYFAGTWQTPLFMGVFAVWIDANAVMRMKNGAPASDFDGGVVGAQT